MKKLGVISVAEQNEKLSETRVVFVHIAVF